MVFTETPYIKGTGRSTEQKPATVIVQTPEGPNDREILDATHHIVTDDEEVHLYLADRRDGIDVTAPLSRCLICRSDRARKLFGVSVDTSLGHGSDSSKDSDTNADEETETVMTDGGRDVTPIDVSGVGQRGEGKTVSSARLRIEGRRDPSPDKRIVSIETGDGAVYRFQRFDTDEPLTVLDRAMPDGSVSTRKSALPKNVERVRDAIGDQDAPVGDGVRRCHCGTQLESKDCSGFYCPGCARRKSLDIIEQAGVEPGDIVRYEDCRWMVEGYDAWHLVVLIPEGLVSGRHTHGAMVYTDVRDVEPVDDDWPVSDPATNCDVMADGGTVVETGDVVTIREEDRFSDPGPWKVKEIRNGEARLWSAWQMPRREPVSDLDVVTKAEETTLPYSIPSCEDNDSDQDPDLVTDGGNVIESGDVVSYDGEQYRVARIGTSNVELYRSGGTSVVAPLSEISLVADAVAVNGGDE